MSDENKFDAKKLGDDLRDRIYQEMSEKMKAKPPAPVGASGIIPGIILMVVGTIFLLDHLNIIRAEYLWRFWPLAIVGVGLVKFFKEADRALGFAFILAGGVVQLYKLGLIGLSWDTIWPFLLIIGGAAMVWSRFKIPSGPFLPRMATGQIANDGGGSVNEYAFFGGVERRVRTSNFRGGSVTAIFGGVELDLRSAEIEGEEAVLFVEAIFGGMEITVPDRWVVSFQVQSIFAGYSDETRDPLPAEVGAAPRKTLVVRGRAVFGGITLKN